MYVAMLRGVNAGGKNKLPMKDLAAIFAAAGCRSVGTYIQSGNVVFEAGEKIVASLSESIPTLIATRFGFEAPVVIRTAGELRKVVQANPFLSAGVDPKTLHVAFLADEPTADLVAELDPHRSPPDEYAIAGREIYLRCPHGLARTKLTNAYFDSRLGTISTIRNWKTTLKLLELAGG